MPADVIQLDPHENMTVDDCVNYVSRNRDDYGHILVIGYDKDGDLIVRSSNMSLADAFFMLVKAQDFVKEQSS